MKRDELNEPASDVAAAVRRAPLEAALAWLGEVPRVALATVIDTWGSAPVPVGGQMAVAPGERFAGSVSGGCVENEIILAAGEVIETGRPQTLTFGVSNETAWAQGLPCGGEITVVIVPLEAADAVPVLEAIAQARNERRALRLVIDTGTGALALEDGPAAGAQAAPARARIEVAGRIALPLLPPPRMLVIGATNIAQHLVEMLRLVRYDTTVIDPRTAYATAERFGSARLVTAWPQDALPRIGLDASTGVVALAHVTEIDDRALLFAAPSAAFYVGALGSTRNHARRTGRLRQAGLSEEAIARIRAPVGLDIGAHGPAEIAASILAEIVLALRGPKRRGPATP